MIKNKQLSQRKLGKLITLLENNNISLDELEAGFKKNKKNSPIIGITGSPGVGKSTIVDSLIETYKKKNLKIAIIAVDPSSIRSGGALLGDRIRMQKHSDDPNIFIRSTATRGHLGGIGKKTKQISELFKLAGFDYIIIETVGVGQTEVEIVKLADIIIGVTSPAQGDEIQVMKASVLELSDIIVLNKSDYKGTENIYKTLLKYTKSNKISDWEVPVIKMIASEKKGINSLIDYIEKYKKGRNI